MAMVLTPLVFVLQNQQQWVVGIPNTAVQYLVRGPTLQLQQNNLLAIVREMQEGAQDFEIDNLSGWLVLGNQDPRAVYAALFEDTNQAIIGNSVVYTCPEPGIGLDDAMQTAGELLEDAFEALFAA